MFHIVRESLTRQTRGTQLLVMLLEQEYALLRAGKPDQVAGIEIPIQELIRQLVREREFLLRMLKGHGFPRLKAYLGTLTEEERACCEQLIQAQTDLEQASARQATQNGELALALWKQSGQLLEQFQGRIAPREQTTYNAHGAWRSRPASPVLVSGRL